MLNGAFFTPSGENSASSYLKASSMVARPASLLTTKDPSAGALNCQIGEQCWKTSRSGSGQSSDLSHLALLFVSVHGARPRTWNSTASAISVPYTSGFQWGNSHHIRPSFKEEFNPRWHLTFLPEEPWTLVGICLAIKTLVLTEYNSKVSDPVRIKRRQSSQVKLSFLPQVRHTYID